MSPDKLVDENDPSTWVAKTKVAPVKFTKWFLLLIKSFVFSKLLYCLWWKTSKTNVHKLQLVQNFVARIILRLRKFDHISERLKSLRMLSVKDRLEINDAVMVFKCLNNLVPKYLCARVQIRSSVSTRVTRSVNNLNIHRCRLATGFV